MVKGLIPNHKLSLQLAPDKTLNGKQNEHRTLQVFNHTSSHRISQHHKQV